MTVPPSSQGPARRAPAALSIDALPPRSTTVRCSSRSPEPTPDALGRALSRDAHLLPSRRAEARTHSSVAAPRDGPGVERRSNDSGLPHALPEALGKRRSGLPNRLDRPLWRADSNGCVIRGLLTSRWDDLLTSAGNPADISGNRVERRSNDSGPYDRWPIVLTAPPSASPPADPGRALPLLKAAPAIGRALTARAHPLSSRRADRCHESAHPHRRFAALTLGRNSCRGARPLRPLAER
jgi:hypothetical protein